MQGFHLCAYDSSIANVADTDLSFVQDDVLGIRNSHMILTDDFNLLASFHIGAVMSRLRFGNISLSYFGNNHLWPINVAATVNRLPQLLDRRDRPLMLPKNEEITLLATNTAAGPTQTAACLFLGTPRWNRNFPQFQDRLMTRATSVVVAGSETTWTALSNLVFERDLRAGVYAVVGAAVVAANAIAFRLRFPDEAAYNGKSLRPGGLVQDSAANEPWPLQFGGFGEWGRFHTFTPPQLQVLADAAGGTYEIRLDLLYLGDDPSLLRSY